MALTPEQRDRLDYLNSVLGPSDLEQGQEVGVATASELAGEDPSFTDLAAATAAQIAISEGGRLGGAAVGSAVPVVGTAVGWVVGGLGAGAAGSITQQRMLGQEIDYGQVVADALLNIVPVPAAFRVLKNKTANEAVFQGLVGTGMATGAEVVAKSISEDRLPTREEMESAGIRGAALGAGLGAVGSKLNDAYIKYSGVSRNDFNRALAMGDPDAKILVDGVTKTGLQHQQDVQKNYSGMRLAIKEATMDGRARLQEMQKTSGGGQIKSKRGIFEVLDDDVDYNLNSRLSEAQIAFKNAEIEDIIDLDNKFLVKQAEELGVDPVDLSQQINKYLYAKHALAFNKARDTNFKAAGGEGGASGITDADASAIIKSFESSGLSKSLKPVIDSRSDLSKQILNTLEDGGIVSKDYANKLRKQYPDYVPLNRQMDEDGSFKPGMYSAFGSDRSVNEIGSNIVGSLSTAIRMAEINKANQSFLRLVRKKNNQKAAKDVVTVYTPKKGESLPENVKSESVVNVFDDGIKTSMSFQDPKVAAAMKGQNKIVLSPVMKAMLWYNRTVGSMYTRWNPDFVIPNLFRDRSEAIVNASAKMDLGNALKVANPVSDIRTIRRNVFNKSGKVSTDPELAKQDALYKQFLEDGGSTGNLGTSTIRTAEDALERLQKNLDNPTSSKGKDFLKWLDNVNNVVEDSTRFNVYRNGLDSGMTRKQAALAARDSSFDPLLKGSKGDALRATYLFANPAIQGGRNFLRSMSNPKVAGAVLGTMMTTTLALDLYNQSIDPEWKEKLAAKDGSTWKTDKSLTVVYGKNEDGSLKTLSIPIGYSMAPFKMTADYLQQKTIQQGLMGKAPSSPETEKNVPEKVVELTGKFINSYNPMGGSLWPTPLRPWTELTQNKDGLGKDIRPPWLETKNISETEKTYPWTMETRGGEMAISFAEQLQNMGYEVSPENLKYLYQTWVGGPGNTVARLFDITSKVVNGEANRITKQDIPVFRRFFGESSKETFEARNYSAETLDTLDKLYGTANQKANRLAYNAFKNIKAKDSQAEKQLVLRNVVSENPILAQRILKSLDTRFKNDRLGMTSSDKSLKRLPPAARAEFIYNRMQTMPPENVNEYLMELQNRKVLTKSVAQLIREMQSLKSLNQ